MNEAINIMSNGLSHWHYVQRNEAIDIMSIEWSHWHYVQIQGNTVHSQYLNKIVALPISDLHL